MVEELEKLARSEVAAKRSAMKNRVARTTDCEKMPETHGQTRKEPRQASLDLDSEEVQESETLLGQGEQPGGDVTKKEEETEKVPRKAKEERPEKMRAQSTDEQDATSGPDGVRTGRGSAGLVRGEGLRGL